MAISNNNALNVSEWIHGAVDFIMAERNQLCASLIFLMISNDLEEVVLPNKDTFNSYGRDYFLAFNVDEETKIHTVRLMERPEEDTQGETDDDE